MQKKKKTQALKHQVLNKKKQSMIYITIPSSKNVTVCLKAGL